MRIPPTLVSQAMRFAQCAQDLQRLGASKPYRRALQPSVRLGLEFLHLRELPDEALSQVDWIVDVGANAGDWTASMLDICSPRRALLIEADPGLASNLRSRFAHRPEVELCSAAATDGRVPSVRLNRTEKSWANSILPPRAEEMNQLYDAGYTVVQTVEVPTTSLDELTAEAREVTVLKIDVQGAELSVLAGAHETLAKTKFVQLEVLFYSHYEGDAFFQDLFDAMADLGFQLCNLGSPMVLNGRAMWSDAVFQRSA